MSLLDFLKKRNAESPLRYELRILFMYHDVLRTHVSFLYRWRIAASRRRMSRGIKRRQGKKPLDVAFLLSVPGMWKLHYVYEAMRCDERYHPYLVLMPYLMCKGYSSEEMLKTMTRTEEFVKAQGYEYVIPYDYTKKKWINIKKSYNCSVSYF